MSYTYHGATDLIALPNRTVQTFPSGLVRVERSFVCRKSQVTTYRRTIKVGEKMPLDDGAPAIDGLYIFPDPSEVVRDDGFVEFRVTAYGRTNKTGQRTAQAPIQSILKFQALYQSVNLDYDPNASTSEPTEERFLESTIPIDYVNVKYKFCIPANQKIQTPEDIRQIGGVFLADTDIDLFSQSFSAADIFPILDSNVTPSSRTRTSPAFSVFPTGFERSNFGKFDEISITYFVQASTIYFGSFFDAGAVPAKQIINSVVADFSAAIISLNIMPYSNGVQVTISGVTQYIPYDGVGSVGGGGAFTLGINRSGQYASLTIGGLAANTVYNASIAAVNQNGAGAAQVIAFKTKSFSDIAI